MVVVVVVVVVVVDGGGGGGGWWGILYQTCKVGDAVLQVVELRHTNKLLHNLTPS